MLAVMGDLTTAEVLWCLFSLENVYFHYLQEQQDWILFAC